VFFFLYSFDVTCCDFVDFVDDLGFLEVFKKNFKSAINSFESTAQPVLVILEPVCHTI